MHSERYYRGKAYWDLEVPLEASSEKSRLRYYKEAERLQIASLWTDREGRERLGKVVVLDVKDLPPPAAEILLQFIRDAEAVE